MRAEDRRAVGFERLRAEACALKHDLDTSSSEAWTDQDLTDLEETVRAEAALEDLVGRRTLIRNLVAEIRVEGAAEVRRACRTLGISDLVLEQAENAGLIRNDGFRIQFEHPLMRAAVYHRAPAPARRATHRALANAIVGETSVSRRAWHLAAAAEGEDERVAAISRMPRAWHASRAATPLQPGPSSGQRE